MSRRRVGTKRIRQHYLLGTHSCMFQKILADLLVIFTLPVCVFWAFFLQPANFSWTQYLNKRTTFTLGALVFYLKRKLLHLINFFNDVQWWLLPRLLHRYRSFIACYFTDYFSQYVSLMLGCCTVDSSAASFLLENYSNAKKKTNKGVRGYTVSCFNQSN